MDKTTFVNFVAQFNVFTHKEKTRSTLIALHKCVYTFEKEGQMTKAKLRDERKYCADNDE